MVHRVRIYRIGLDGGAASQMDVYDAPTADEAIALGMSRVGTAAREACPLVFEIYDPTDRLVLSYTSEVRPMPVLV